MLAFGFCLMYSFIIASLHSPLRCTVWNARPAPLPKCAHECENVLFSPPLYHLLHLSRGQSHACRCSGQKPRGHPAPLSFSYSTSVNWEAVRASCHHCLPPGLLQHPPCWLSCSSLPSTPQPESPSQMVIRPHHTSAQKPQCWLPFH